MAELFKFRCPDCRKLLGVPPRKVGRAVHCPRCRAELIVPDPTSTDDHDDPEGESFDLGIDLGFASPLDVRPEGAPGPPAERPDQDALQAIAFLETAAGLPDPPATPAETEEEFDPDDEPEPIVRPAAEPLTPRAQRSASRATFEGRRDVVLPRTAAIAWALFALLALALSFAAGLMIGHYRWK